MNCPSCGFEYTYEEGEFLVCSACQFKFKEEDLREYVIDAHGNKLFDGDEAIILKDLKVKGSSQTLKQGTKVTNIVLVNNGDHNFDARVPGFGVISLKSEFVKKT